METLEEVKKKAWKFYDVWRASKTFCPALKTEIRVSLKGWNHLLGTGSHKRQTKDIIRRLKLLRLARKVIEAADTTSRISNRHKKSFYVLEKTIGEKKIRVVLIEDRLGNKIFYSVMDKKKGAPHASALRR